MFDAGYICKKIYKAVYLVRLMGKSLDPVAYIHIKAGRGAFVEANELYEQFAKIKWNTPLSTADLEISLDESLAENVLKKQKRSNAQKNFNSTKTAIKNPTA